MVRANPITGKIEQSPMTPEEQQARYMSAYGKSRSNSMGSNTNPNQTPESTVGQTFANKPRNSSIPNGFGQFVKSQYSQNSGRTPTYGSAFGKTKSLYERQNQADSDLEYSSNMPSNTDPAYWAETQATMSDEYANRPESTWSPAGPGYTSYHQDDYLKRSIQEASDRALAEAKANGTAYDPNNPDQVAAYDADAQSSGLAGLGEDAFKQQVVSKPRTIRLDNGEMYTVNPDGSITQWYVDSQTGISTQIEITDPLEKMRIVDYIGQNMPKDRDYEQKQARKAELESLIEEVGGYAERHPSLTNEANARIEEYKKELAQLDAELEGYTTPTFDDFYFETLIGSPEAGSSLAEQMYGDDLDKMVAEAYGPGASIDGVTGQIIDADGNPIVNDSMPGSESAGLSGVDTYGNAPGVNVTPIEGTDVYVGDNGQVYTMDDSGQLVSIDQARYNKAIQDRFDAMFGTGGSYADKFSSLTQFLAQADPALLYEFANDPALRDMFMQGMLDTWGADTEGGYDWLTLDALRNPDGSINQDLFNQWVGARREVNKLPDLMRRAQQGDQAAWDTLMGPNSFMIDDYARFLADSGYGFGAQYDDNWDAGVSYLASLDPEARAQAIRDATARNMMMLLNSGGAGAGLDTQFLPGWYSDILGFDMENPLEGEWSGDVLPYLDMTNKDNFVVANLPTYARNGYQFNQYGYDFSDPAASGLYQSLAYAYLLDALDSIDAYGRSGA